MRLLLTSSYRIAAIFFAALPFAAATNYYPNGHDQVSTNNSTQGNTEQITWRIDRPFVTQRDTSYPQIAFRPGDRISFQAGGCVQTGGHGATWKSYVHPQGANSDRLYSGLLWIPGVTGGGLQRIEGLLSKTFTVPGNLPSVSATNLILHLGYEDDAYGDNGYYAHDNGNNDQCKGVGDAWVEVRVTRVKGLPPPPITYSPHQGPFDLVWKEVDANLIPFNPIWALQIEHPAQRPALGASCGAGSAAFRMPCTSQTPSFDLSEQVFEFAGVCKGEPLHGHANWMIATYDGIVRWQDHSPSTFGDDDYNFGLFRIDNAALTNQGQGLGLEFEARETIDHFTSPWWVQFHNAVDGHGGSAPNALVDGKYAIVTGLFGIDGVHGGWSESHPVYSMAIRIGTVALAGGIVEEQWAFFIRNWGNEGQCSHFQHYFDAASNGRYYLQVPWRTAATSFQIVQGKTIVRSSSIAARVLGFEQSPNTWVYVKVALPPGTTEPRVHGEFTLRWIPSPGHTIALASVGEIALANIPKQAHPDEDAATTVQALNKIKNVPQRKAVGAILTEVNATAANLQPDSHIDNVNTTVGQHAQVALDPKSVKPRKDRQGPDVEAQRRRALLRQRLEARFGKGLSELHMQGK